MMNTCGFGHPSGCCATAHGTMGEIRGLPKYISAILGFENTCIYHAVNSGLDWNKLKIISPATAQIEYETKTPDKLGRYFFSLHWTGWGGVVLFTEKERKGSWATLWNTDSHALDKIRIR